ncbi:hypothetical protein [Natronorubrum sediminis]|nr:hypothetical protein [Natronorubrum sediminis]
MKVSDVETPRQYFIVVDAGEKAIGRGGVREPNGVSESGGAD